MPSSPLFNQIERLRKGKKLHFLYNELCDAFLWNGDSSSREILAHLADGTKIENIHGILTSSEGIYHYDATEVSTQLANVEKLLGA